MNSPGQLEDSTKFIAHARGFVQGVGYRAFVKHQADLLGVAGWARNLPDGTVQVFAIGKRSDLERLVRRLWQGPPGARVVGIEFDWVHAPEEETSGFQVR